MFIRNPLPIVALLFTVVLVSTTAARTETSAPTAAFVVIVHKSTSTETLSLKQLRFFYLGEIRQWPDHRRVVLIQRDPSSDGFKQLLEVVVRMSAAEYRRFQMNTEFRGDEPLTLKTLNSPESACNFVFNVPGALGIVESVALFSAACKERVKFVPITDLRSGGR